MSVPPRGRFARFRGGPMANAIESGGWLQFCMLMPSHIVFRGHHTACPFPIFMVSLALLTALEAMANSSHYYIQIAPCSLDSYLHECDIITANPYDELLFLREPVVCLATCQNRQVSADGLTHMDKQG